MEIIAVTFAALNRPEQALADINVVLSELRSRDASKVSSAFGNSCLEMQRSLSDIIAHKKAYVSFAVRPPHHMPLRICSIDNNCHE